MNIAKAADVHLKCFPPVFPAHTHVHHPHHHSPHRLITPFRPLSRRCLPTTSSRVPHPLPPCLLSCPACLLSKTCLYWIVWIYLLFYCLSSIITFTTQSPGVESTSEGTLAVSLSICIPQNEPGTPVGTDLLTQ